MTKILFIEDDVYLGTLLKDNFEIRGFNMCWCKDGTEGLRKFYEEEFDLCILDVMLPKTDGFTTARELRKFNPKIPFVFLTARSMDVDKYRGFELGCDDYITKPFSAQELFFRINAILRRSTTTGTMSASDSTEKDYIVGNFSFDFMKRKLTGNGLSHKLSSKEAELLHMLIANKNKLIDRKQILIKIWGKDDYFTSKTLDVYLSKIRKLIKEDDNLELLNAYGSGYKLIEKISAPDPIIN